MYTVVPPKTSGSIPMIGWLTAEPTQRPVDPRVGSGVGGMDLSTNVTPRDIRTGGIEVIARAADILRLLQAHPGGLSQAEVSDRLGLARSTAGRILLALEAERLVASGQRGPYRLGPEITRMAGGARRSAAVEIHPFLQELSREIGETVDLSVLEGGAATFVDQVVAPHRLRAVSTTGDSIPLHCCANGKALLAAQPPSYIAEHLPSSLPRLTPNTITTSRALRKEIDVVRRTGIAVDREEQTVGICAVGTALDDLGQAFRHERFAVSIPIPAQRFLNRQDELGEELREWVQRVNATLRKASS